MGNCLQKDSTAAGPDKDVDDRTLEELDLDETKVSSFDDAFGVVADVCNSMVTTNNNMVSSIENMSSCAAALVGAIFVKVGDGYKVSLFKPATEEEEEKELTPEELEKLCCVNPGLRGALTEVNLAAAAALKCEGKLKTGRNDRLKVIAKGKEGKEARQVAMNYNIFMFGLKREAMKTCGKDAMSPSAALSEIIANLKKTDPNMRPKLKVDEEALQAAASGGSVDATSVVTLDMGRENPVPKHLQIAYDSILGEEGLLAAISSTIEEVSGFKEKCEGAQGAVEALPKEPSAMQEAISGAGLSPMQGFSVIKIVPANVTACAGGPAIAKQTMETLKWLIGELQAGVKSSSEISGVGASMTKVSVVSPAQETQPSSPQTVQ